MSLKSLNSFSSNFRIYLELFSRYFLGLKMIYVARRNCERGLRHYGIYFKVILKYSCKWTRRALLANWWWWCIICQVEYVIISCNFFYQMSIIKYAMYQTKVIINYKPRIGLNDFFLIQSSRYDRAPANNLVSNGI